MPETPHPELIPAAGGAATAVAPDPIAATGEPTAPTNSLGRLLTFIFPATAALYALFNGIGQVVLPAQVEALDPASKIRNLALVTTVAAVASMIAIPTGGALSDRTRTRFGRRAPWLAVSTVASAILTVFMGLASSLATLVLAALLLWFAANFYGGVISAVLPDRVPVARRGIASAVIGLGTPIGIVLGVNLASRVSQLSAYSIFAIVLVIGAALFLVGAREQSSVDMPRAVREPRTRGAAVRAFFAAFSHRDFRLAFFSRFGLFASYFTVSGYGFYTFQDYIGAENVPGGNIALAVSTTLTVSIGVWVVVASIAGWLADKLDRRKLFVGVSAIGMAATMSVPLLMPTWTGMLIYSALLGAFIGTYFAIDLAVMSLVLPSADDEGRDLGILQVATGLPQLLSPVVAGALITFLGGYTALFVFGALCALISGVLMLRIRSLR